LSKQLLIAKSMIKMRTRNSTILVHLTLNILDRDQEVEQLPSQAQDQLLKAIKVCPKNLKALALAEEAALINILSRLAK